MSHAERRVMLIKKILATFERADKEDVKMDEEKLIVALGGDHGVSRRTALDYIRCAKDRLNRIKTNTQSLLQTD